jgi:hypothetical protein
MIARKGKRGAQKCLLLIKYTLFEPKTKKRFWQNGKINPYFLRRKVSPL